MLATAFEILLDFPDGAGEKKKYFADTMRTLLGVPGLRTSIRTVGRPPPTQIDYPLPAAWACDFYKLRSTITHGDEVAEAQWTFEGLPSPAIAKVLFTLALIQELWKAELIPDHEAELMADIARSLNIPSPANVPRPPHHPWIEQAFRGIKWIPVPLADVSPDVTAGTT